MITPPKSLDLTLPNTPLTKIKPKKGTHLWLKRDDITGIELSGNKIRKLDFLMQEAIDRKSEGIITCGGLQSNHCRAAAYAAVKVGLGTILYLRGKPEEQSTGNHFLNQLVGAAIQYVTPEEYLNIDSIMAEKSQDLLSDHRNFYVIPEGGSNEIGAWGYISCFNEIVEQITEQRIDLDAIVVSTGSGGTHAGLLLGKLITNSDIDIISINVCDDSQFFKEKIMSIIDKFADRYGQTFDIRSQDIQIFDGFTGEGYGIISNQEVDIIRRFAQEEGIVLDPVYTAKAYLGLETLIDEGIIEYENVLFIHTGGIFGVFPYANKFI
jgi:D-cysteine desulfhydrase